VASFGAVRNAEGSQDDRADEASRIANIVSEAYSTHFGTDSIKAAADRAQARAAMTARPAKEREDGMARQDRTATSRRTIKPYSPARNMPGCFIPVPITLNGASATPGAGGTCSISPRPQHDRVTAEKVAPLHS